MNSVLGRAKIVWIRAGKVILATAACIARCCGGGGGEPYKIYLCKYCTRCECKDLLWVWSNEIAYADVLWKDTGGWFKFGGVCYGVSAAGECSCEELGPSCCDAAQHAGQADGPPIDGSVENCGPCCGDQDHCQSTSFWSCAEQRWKCFECGEEYGTYVRATHRDFFVLTPEYIADQDACGFRDSPNYVSCWNGGLMHDTRESMLVRMEYTLRPNPDRPECLGRWGECLQSQRDWNQGIFCTWNNGNPCQFGNLGANQPPCTWWYDNGTEDLCPPGDWNGGPCGDDTNPLTGENMNRQDHWAGGCGYTRTWTDASGTVWTETVQTYRDGQTMSASRTLTALFFTNSCLYSLPHPPVRISHGTQTWIDTYVRQHTVISPCDADTLHGCGVRAVCADRGNRPPPPDMPEKYPKLSRGVKLTKRNTPPQSTGDLL